MIAADIQIPTQAQCERWLAMPTGEAMKEIHYFMTDAGGYSPLDHILLFASTTVAEALGVVFGI